jgi:hypothetical protein
MSGLSYLFMGRDSLRVRLHILKRDNAAEYPVGKRFSFAVVDLDRAKAYPLNFVCMLPMHISSNGHKTSTFEKQFGRESVDLAKKLLDDALKVEDGLDVKGEVERRLKLLAPELACEKVCVSCGRVFHAELGRSFRKKFCEDCLRKKFGGRE